MKQYKFFTNKDCEYYPCHDFEEINCLFCFCPIYNLDCPGQYTYTRKGIKDCSNCTWVHNPNNYDKIMNILKGEKI